MSFSTKILNRKIQINTSIIDALTKMDSIDRKLLLVFDDSNFVNVLSIGDIQRAIIGGKNLTETIEDVLRVETKVAKESDNFEDVKAIMEKFRMELMPVVDENNHLINVYFWEDVFKTTKRPYTTILNLPVIIMAGGKGTRMKPITNIIPKPLIPFGDKSIIEQIIDRFQRVGCNNFHVSINYKAEMIKFYFEQIEDKKYEIDFFEENKPLGTAGSLHLLSDKIHTTFFVSNCDILIEDDYEQIHKYHLENENELTIVSAVKNYSIPYGTLDTKAKGLLEKIVEKPDLSFQINTGFYIVEPHLLKEVPKDEFFHITHLIQKILDRNGRVGVYPVSEGSWKDIGVWEEYLRNNKIS